jgi:two-component system sensor histidine kinase UhpB
MSVVTPRASPPRLPAVRVWPWLRQISTFERVIAANSVIIILDTVAGWWITQHNPETYHYLIDTSFIALAALLGLIVNFALLRAAFAPLHGVLATIRAVEQGDLGARARTRESDPDALALARAFNAMLDRLALARDDAAARVLRAQEEERRRLALELHDETGQSLTALTLHAEAIAQRLTSEQSAAARQARLQATHLATLAQRTLAEVQALSRQLRPPMLDDLGLVAALRWLAEDARERLGVQVQVCTRGVVDYSVPEQEDSPRELAAQNGVGRRAAQPNPKQLPATRLPTEVETALFRIAQESVTNAVRHGQARQVRSALRQTATRVTLVIADNGRGFDSPAGDLGLLGRLAQQGQGLQGMAERARLLGGTLSVRSWPGRGCVVRVAIRLPAEHTAGASDRQRSLSMAK